MFFIIGIIVGALSFLIYAIYMVKQMQFEDNDINITIEDMPIFILALMLGALCNYFSIFIIGLIAMAIYLEKKLKGKVLFKLKGSKKST